MCYEAMERGELDQPACTKACPEQATVFFSSRDEALAEARRRIAASPGTYFEDRIWGEHQVGGTAVLYLSDVSLDSLSWQHPSRIGSEPLPHSTERILATVPWTFGGVCALMAGTFWFIRRRQEVTEAEHSSEAGPAVSADDAAAGAEEES
jgi:formate dehydrogenase iron-sulfur subunit